MRLTTLTISTVAALVLTGIGVAHAATTPIKSTHACSHVYAAGKPTTTRYACLAVNGTSAPAAAVVHFTALLGHKALQATGNWTGGSNTVCLSRYTIVKGVLRENIMSNACASVSKSGAWGVRVNLHTPGGFYYGLMMGPCAASQSLCGNGDPGLVGVDSTHAVWFTTAK